MSVIGLLKLLVKVSALMQGLDSKDHNLSTSSGVMIHHMENIRRLVDLEAVQKKCSDSQMPHILAQLFFKLIRVGILFRIVAVIKVINQ